MPVIVTEGLGVGWAGKIERGQAIEWTLYYQPNIL